eukprot:15463398-Alexandrium_andersonii.AAC.1
MALWPSSGVVLSCPAGEEVGLQCWLKLAGGRGWLRWRLGSRCDEKPAVKLCGRSSQSGEALKDVHQSGTVDPSSVQRVVRIAG